MNNTAEANYAGTRDSRFNIRATSQEKALVEQAASLVSITASRFVVQAAVRSAEEVLADQTRFVVAPEKWDAFAEALDRPARVLPALRKAASKPSPFSER